MKRVVTVYALLLLALTLWNAVPETIVDEVDVPGDSLRFASIPAGYVAAHFRGRNVPAPLRDGNVQAFTVHQRRGWPAKYQNAFGYQYLISSNDGATEILSGFPNGGRTRLWLLCFNLVGVIACVAVMHAAVVWWNRIDARLRAARTVGISADV